MAVTACILLVGGGALVMLHGRETTQNLGASGHADRAGVASVPAPRPAATVVAISAPVTPIVAPPVATVVAPVVPASATSTRPSSPAPASDIRHAHASVPRDRSASSTGTSAAAHSSRVIE